MEIITNNRPRNLIYGCELTAKERADFDYISAEEFDSHAFLRYCGRVYDFSEFVRAPASFAPWDGWTNDTYFSGVLIKEVPGSDGESWIMGRYFS